MMMDDTVFDVFDKDNWTPEEIQAEYQFQKQRLLDEIWENYCKELMAVAF